MNVCPPAKDYNCNTGKCKAILAQACIDPGGRRRLRLPDFVTFGTLGG
jgi:hypothetical protein